MTHTSEIKTDEKGRYLGCHRVLRSDAVRQHRTREYLCPTSQETKWIASWQEFKAAGGQICFNGDQTEIELLLPEPFKFSIKFSD